MTGGKKAREGVLSVECWVQVGRKEYGIKRRRRRKKRMRNWEPTKEVKDEEGKKLWTSETGPSKIAFWCDRGNHKMYQRRWAKEERGAYVPSSFSFFFLSCFSISFLLLLLHLPRLLSPSSLSPPLHTQNSVSLGSFSLLHSVNSSSTSRLIPPLSVCTRHSTSLLCKCHQSFTFTHSYSNNPYLTPFATVNQQCLTKIHETRWPKVTMDHGRSAGGSFV